MSLGVRGFGRLPGKAVGCRTVWQFGRSRVRLFDADQATAEPGVPEHRTVCMGDGELLVGLDRSEPARELATDADGSGGFANLQDEAIGRSRPTASLPIDAAHCLCWWSGNALLCQKAQHLLDGLSKPDSRVPLNRLKRFLIPMLVERGCVHLGVVRRVVVRPNRTIRPLPVVAVVVVDRDPALDSNHLADVQIGPVKEIQTGFDAAHEVSNPMEWGIRIDSYDGLGFFEKAQQRGEVVVNCLHTAMAFWWERLLRRSLYEL